MDHGVDDTISRTITRTGRGSVAVRAFFVVVLVGQAVLLARSYADPHNFFGFQPFNESSTWQADIVRVTVDGRRVSIDDPWPGGYRWNDLVGWGVLEDPARPKHAYSGLGATLDFLDQALDWVADHTPADTETLYLEADVVGYRNTRGPEHHVYRSHDRDEAR